MRTQRRDLDDGFSLIEVLIAMVMIGIVASSALWFFINGMRTSSDLGRQQTAVSVASSALEDTFVVAPQKSITAGVPGLVVGRSASAVTAAQSALSSDLPGVTIAGMTNTYPLSDPAGGTPVVPIKQTVNRAGVNYTVYTLVGSCYRKVTTNGAAEQCDKVLPTYPSTEPTTVPALTVRLLRVTVVATWDPIGNECNGKCYYDVSTLVEPSADLVWNRVFDPEAVDDLWTFNPTDPLLGPLTLVPLANDWMASVPVNPASIVTPLPGGVGTLDAFTSNGTAIYRPPGKAAGTWKSGIFSFTYQIRDIPGKTSQGVGKIQLLPYSTDDSDIATNNVPKVINVIANDQGSPVTVTIVSGPAHGTATASGTTVTYTPNTGGIIDTFAYTYTDGSGQTSPPATVSVNVAAASIADALQVVPYRPNSTATWVDISSTLRGVGGNGASINVLDYPKAVATGVSNGELRIDGVVYTGGTKTGTVVEFQPASGAVGEWKFPFSMTLGAYTTAQANATMRVNVKATNDSAGTFSKNGTRTYVAGANDFPVLWSPASGVTVVLGSFTCSNTSWVTTPAATKTADLAAGQVRMLLPNQTQSGCVANYTLNASGSTSSATITYKTQ